MAAAAAAVAAGGERTGEEHVCRRGLSIIHGYVGKAGVPPSTTQTLIRERSLQGLAWRLTDTHTRKIIGYKKISFARYCIKRCVSLLTDSCGGVSVSMMMSFFRSSSIVLFWAGRRGERRSLSEALNRG